MFTKRIPVFYTIIVSLIIVAACYFISHSRANATNNEITINTTTSCPPHIVRLPGYKYVNKLLYVENGCESEEFSGLKTEIQDYIQGAKNAGKLTNASVYMRVYNTKGEWLCVNPDEEYHPSSLLKLPVLFTFARMAETNPAILDKKVLFSQHSAALPQQMFVSRTLQPGTSYTIRQLLQYLIEYSDNDALVLLYNYHNDSVYQKIFTELELPYNSDPSVPPLGMKVKDYSVLLRVLYNGTYLSLASSEYALSLLTQSDFKKGVMQGIPDSITVAHKFGEYFTPAECQLHEAALVYAPKYHYIITVMTKGKDMQQLSEVIGTISKMAYYRVGQ